MEKGYIYVITSMLIFSSMGLFVRLTSLSGLVIYFFAALIATIIFGSILIKEGRLKSFFKKRFIWIPITIGFLGVINNVSYFFAFQLTTISNATFLHLLAPVLVILIAPLILKEKTEKRLWIPLILAVLGLIILLRSNTLNLTENSTLGIFLAIISAFALAFIIIFFKKASKFYTPKEILFSQMFFSVIILAPFIFYIKPVIQVSDILFLLTLGAVHQGFAVLLYIKSFKELPAQNVSIINYLEPIGASVLAFIFLMEIPSIYTIIGGLLILTSSYLTIKKTKS